MYVRVYLYTRMYICMHVHRCLYTCIYMYIHTYLTDTFYRVPLQELAEKFHFLKSVKSVILLCSPLATLYTLPTLSTNCPTIWTVQFTYIDRVLQGGYVRTGTCGKFMDNFLSFCTFSLLVKVIFWATGPLAPVSPTPDIYQLKCNLAYTAVQPQCCYKTPQHVYHSVLLPEQTQCGGPYEPANWQWPHY